MKRLLSVAVAFSLCVSAVWAAKPVKAVISDLKGKAYVNNGSGWTKCYQSMPVDENMSIKTEPRSKVTVLTNDNSKIQMKANSQMKFNSLSGDNRVVELQKGKSVFKVARLWGGRKFQCKTPVAVCSVRGTEFAVEVGENNETSFKVFEGLVNVGDFSGGSQIDVAANEKVDLSATADLSSAKATAFTASDTSEKSENTKEELKQTVGVEVSADMTKEAIQKAAADEIRLAEYQNKKTMIDVFGNRVKVETYVVRPAADEIKLVILNERKDRYDYMANHRIFNKDLPSDMSTANSSWYNWQQNPTTTAPDYYVKQNDLAASNTVDLVEWGYTGGQISGAAFNYTAYFKIAGQSRSLVTASVDYPLGYGTGTTFETRQATLDDGSTFREDYYLVTDLGKNPSTSEYQSLLSDLATGKTEKWFSYNQEMVFTCDKFKGPGQKIDLCIDPVVFKDSGMVVPTK